MLKGVLEYELDMQIMQQVSNKYEKLGLVPKTFFMPEFYQGAQNEDNCYHH